MNTTIHYSSLFDLIDTYPDCIQHIKDNYLELLSELTVVEPVDTETFLENVSLIHKCGHIIVGYIYNNDGFIKGTNITNTNMEENVDLIKVFRLYYEDFIRRNIEIICSGTIIIEPKIIHGCKNVGHIEDIVVKSAFRGNNLSQTILHKLKIYAEEKNCYKVILDCHENLKKNYMRNGFEVKGIQMAVYFV